jgi:cytochrome c oxidase subunit II
MALLHALSVQAEAMRSDWWVFIVAGAFVWVVVAGLIVYASVRWRARAGNENPPQFSSNAPIEITSVVVPLLMVTGLFLYSNHAEDLTDALAASPADRVDVTAYRWSWRFAYAGSPVAVYGTPQAPPTLYLPVNRTVQIDLRSDDVTHSFWVPALLFKRDAIPGLVNRFDISPARVGTYPGRCAQFCGLEHALMTFTVRVVPDAAYDRYLASGGVTPP